MISPTMMMETEVDTDTDTIEENDDKNNIYEEVLNNETFRLRHNHSKLSTTSSIYRNSWWDSHHNNVLYQQVIRLKHCQLLLILFDLGPEYKIVEFLSSFTNLLIFLLIY